MFSYHPLIVKKYYNDNMGVMCHDHLPHTCVTGAESSNRYTEMACRGWRQNKSRRQNKSEEHTHTLKGG